MYNGPPPGHDRAENIDLRGPDRLQLEELWRELIPHESPSVGIGGLFGFGLGAFGIALDVVGGARARSGDGVGGCAPDGVLGSGRLGDFEQNGASVQVADLEPREVDVVDVGVRTAEVRVCDAVQPQHIVGSDGEVLGRRVSGARPHARRSGAHAQSAHRPPVR